MADNKHQVSVVIGAALSSGFKEAISTSQTDFFRLGGIIKELDSSTLGVASKFQDLQRKTLEAKRAWIESEAEVKRLAVALKSTENPSAAMVREFEKSKTAAAKAKDAYIGKRDALHNLSEQIKTSGNDIGTLVSQQSKLGSSIANLKTRYGELSKIMGQRNAVLAQRANLRGQMMDAVALAATLGAPIKAAVDFESAMADVAKVVDFPEPDGLLKMGNSLKEMSRTIPLSAEGLAQITASGGQLGVASKDLGAFTESVAKMSTAFDMTAEEAGNAMAQLSNVFQIPITDLTQLGDAVNHLSNNTAAKAKDIVPALNRAGGSVRQFGLSAQQASALVGTLIAMGQQSEKAGTAVSAILIKLQIADKAGAKVQKAFGAIGISAQDMKKAISEDAQGALLQFFDALEKIKPQERAGILVDIFGKDYQKDVALLVGSLDSYKKSLALISDPKAYGGSMEKEFQARAATTANNLRLLKNSISEIAMNLGSTLLPSINKLVDGLRAIGSTVSDFAKAHPEVVTAITGTVGVLISCKVAAIALGYAWTFVKGGILSASAVIKGIQVAFAILQTKLLAAGTVLPTVTTAFRALTAVVTANPIGAAITALAVGATLIIANWEKVKAFFTTIWDSIKPIWEKFSNFATGIFDKITSPFATIKSSIGSLFSSSEKNKSPEVQKTLPTSKTNDSTMPESKKSWIGSLFSSSDEKQKTESLKLPQISKANVSKNQNNSFNITVNATPDQNPTSIANSVSEKMKEFSGAFLYDSIGEVP
ncbi:hypothetical protein FACS1894122_09380 [Alphaproteobacteria bacterium]|nr:hypothetical protein FACS1894122_09380 [Alphaproteobacteria bacterium]